MIGGLAADLQVCSQRKYQAGREGGWEREVRGRVRGRLSADRDREMTGTHDRLNCDKSIKV